MSKEQVQAIIRLLENNLSNAADNAARATRQFTFTQHPYDEEVAHDYEVVRNEAEALLEAFKAAHGS